MNKYKVKITYGCVMNFNVTAKNKKEAEEYAWFEFDQSQPHEPEMEIKKIK